MKLMEDVFFSFTFGGETLSLAAALATMTKLQKKIHCVMNKQQASAIHDLSFMESDREIKQIPNTNLFILLLSLK